MSSHNFKLKKWYFDGISEDGRAIVCYSAVMSWRMLSVQYASYLYLDANGRAHSGSRYRDAPLPVLENDNIRWEDGKFRIKGEWHAAAAPVRTKLHDSEEGYLDWHCYQPAAHCHIQLREETPISGYGYAECLEMTIPPWKMGFSELRWGRLAHPESPIVWIDLRGEPNRSWIFNGQELIRTEHHQYSTSTPRRFYLFLLVHIRSRWNRMFPFLSPLAASNATTAMGYELEKRFLLERIRTDKN